MSCCSFVNTNRSRSFEKVSLLNYRMEILYDFDCTRSFSGWFDSAAPPLTTKLDKSLLVSFCKLDRQASITAFQLLLFQGGHDGRVRSKSAAAVAPTTPFSFSSRAIKATMQKVTGS
ncbi:conserved domain protein [Trichinella spiralis]|uniref:hypothetical protein n=1 Tax=Trichinella spiralis TaxID=6334 RepID=UPI0001EFBF8F|nr:conserved domain protein [Trichinella spiralis]